MIIGLLCIALIAASESNLDSVDSAERTPRSECGLICLQACSTIVGRPVNTEDVRTAIGTFDETRGVSLRQVQQAADRLGLVTAAVRWHEVIPSGIEQPAILPVTLKNGDRHFVTLVRSREEAAFVLDFPFPPSWMGVAELREQYHWDGTALYLAAAEEDLDTVRSHTGWQWRHATVAALAAAAILLAPRIIRWSMCRSRPTKAHV